MANHSLHRTRQPRSDCNPSFQWAGSLAERYRMEEAASIARTLDAHGREEITPRHNSSAFTSGNIASAEHVWISLTNSFPYAKVRALAAIGSAMIQRGQTNDGMMKIGEAQRIRKQLPKVKGYLQRHDTVELTYRDITVWAYAKRGKYLGRVELNRAGISVATGKKGTKRLGNLSSEKLFEQMQK